MNALKAGYCSVTGQEQAFYAGIGQDANGNNLMTGDGGGIQGDTKNFTCVEIEVFKITI